MFKNIYFFEKRIKIYLYTRIYKINYNVIYLLKITVTNYKKKQNLQSL